MNIMKTLDCGNSGDKTITAISGLQSLSYALPLIPTVMLLAPMNIVHGVYARHYAIELTTLAIIIFISRLFDGISDPIIGYYSDRYRCKYGTRKPFIIVGGLMVLLCAYFLYVPTNDISSIYFGFWFIAFYAAYTLYEIPHLSWPSDIAKTSKDKTKLYFYRTLAGYFGLVCFYGIPLLPFFESNEITPQTLKMVFIVAAVLLVPSLLQSIRAVPSGKLLRSSIRAKPNFSLVNIRAAAREIVSNKPFSIFLVAFSCAGFSVGMWYGLIYIYVDAYLNMGDKFAQMFLISFIIGILVTPVWYKLAIKYGKKNSWLFSMIILIFSFLFTGTLKPGAATFEQLLALKVIQTCGFVCIGIVTNAMLSEITDYSTWKNGEEKNATYFSLKVFLEKTNAAVGAALGLAITAWFGFDVDANEHANNSILGLKAAIVWVPSLFGVISLIFIGLSPVDERRHEIVRRRLRSMSPEHN